MESNFKIHPDREIVNTRVFDVPVALLYKAWSAPEHLKNWWGPMGFSNTFHEFDFRPGGRWRFTMHGPEKGNYENECEFMEIKPHHHITWKRHSQPFFNIVAQFESLSGHSTQLFFRMQFATPEACSKLRPYVVDKNEENFDRLEEELARMKGL